MNKKGSGWQVALVIFGVLFFIALITILSLVGSYNNLVDKDVNVENSWAKVQTAYERRADLIPNLVETVKGAVKFEQETQTEVARLRSGIANAKTPNELATAGDEMNSFISGIMVNVEAYPDLKANQNFLALQDELAGTENRIKWERDNYNDAVATYKVQTRRFPTNIIARAFGFEEDKWEMFKAEEGAEDAPEVQF